MGTATNTATAAAALAKGSSLEGLEGVYAASAAERGGDRVAMVKDGGERKLLAVGGGALYNALEGAERTEEGVAYKLCPLTHANRLALNEAFDYTRPRAIGTQTATIGLGDRLGLASPGHIQTTRGRDVRPILAQQSIRELTLTGRTYEDVLDAASYAVFQEGYKDGWGADGDHLKTTADIEYALRLGFSMLTLDASEHIDNAAGAANQDEIERRYESELDAGYRSRLEAEYANQAFEIPGATLELSSDALKRYALVYGKAIAFMVDIYRKYIEPAGRPIDFEISIDETATPTDPAAHWFVASELKREGVEVYSMAPRFCGEFQKGIDYIGDLAQFEKELAVHAAICDYFGYKLSVHSGSDKFSVFPLVARYTKGRFHLKTAGTNWLEAVRAVARVNPSLYRRMHAYAAAHVEEALKYYHVSADFTKIKPLGEVSDAELPEYMNEDNARQLIHITYGILLTAKDENGASLFKDEFYATLRANEDAYEAGLIAHIGKHLELLNK
ncbi:tagaturonate epimerase family protein [Paenibacillus sp.]|uniref:tagaturonate epimerase family protein n=1 Tax=Paenibacillus sp. TaxID=58172 RepID=UPI002D5695BF|nr:tagaturonate epimerase family protein [Paenibacillus sp.]HZG54920.1 tagaturonate epimerase family protein [Paenibacillus sp.]